MAETTVTRTIAERPDAVWALLADFGNVSWIPGTDNTVVEGDGPGMRRLIPAGDGDPIDEQLHSIDHAARVFVYTVDNSPMPTTEYRSTCTVRAAGDGTEVEWAVTFEPIGEEQEAAAVIDMVYGMMAEWIGTALADG